MWDILSFGEEEEGEKLWEGTGGGGLWVPSRGFDYDLSVASTLPLLARACSRSFWYECVCFGASCDALHHMITSGAIIM